MIQRIQTIYLLLALILTVSLFFSEMAALITAQEYFALTFKGIIDQSTNDIVIPSVALTILLIISVMAIFTAIFSFKKRLLQIRLCGLSIGLLIGVSILIFFFGKTAANELDAELAFNWPLIVPVISVILVFLAMRAIGKDEALVRSLNRIR